MLPLCGDVGRAIGGEADGEELTPMPGAGMRRSGPLFTEVPTC